ncbi:hypothetical protein A6A04_04770 [Paramagnetospirillum marisnigri]|uniref:DUF1269 domain-containing protein n=1 Tax=Paramagnetospirillum marisnigri TaxID=1285242 RepID=A0A178MHN5_9PROT|nr:hypothetical protein [Paramagnetospirillum marisnigri]OAN48073.1 hypothetical protein A6A04_04770 [Paramagnetospirillum marisnigri]
MTAQTNPHPAALREVVGTFADRGQFEAGVSALLEAGFDRGRLSVLASHDSLDAAGGKAQKWRDGLIALVGEAKFEGPLVAAGLIALAAGPVGAVIAGLIAAGVGGVAVKELLDEVAAIPDTEDFTRALAAGSVILWVSVETPAEEDRAKAALAQAGGANIHIFERAKGKRHA